MTDGPKVAVIGAGSWGTAFGSVTVRVYANPDVTGCEIGGCTNLKLLPPMAQLEGIQA